MPRAPVAFIHINIHNVAVQANTLLNTGVRATQENNMNACNCIQNSGSQSDTPPIFSRATERRVEAQPRIRQKLEEVSSQPQGSLSRFALSASLATQILSVIENNVSGNMRLMDLAMDAHAVAYIAVITSLHRPLNVSETTTRHLNELLSTIHTFLVEATIPRNAVARFRRMTTKNRRKDRVMNMREELLNLLRQIERDDDADIVPSLNAALDLDYTQ